MTNVRIFKFASALLISCIFTWPVIVSSQEDIKPNPTRPSASDNAYLTHQGYTELEFGLASRAKSWNLPLLLKLGFHENFELGLSMSGLIEHTSEEYSLGDPGLQLKAQLFNQAWGAVAAVGRIEHINNTKPRYTVYGVASLPLQIAHLDGTFGGVFTDQGTNGYAHSFTYAVFLSPNLKAPVTAYLEIFGEKAESSNPVSFDCGIFYPISKKIVLDLSITIGLNDDAEDWVIQVGFTTLLFKLLR